MFEITSEDIARLDDEQLRAVVARLCEAEVRQRGLSPSCVKWGGNHNSADGGIDVRVALAPGTLIDGFVPRPATGFQVKRQDMPHGAITDEMRPSGILRPSIVSLARQCGAYIIVSSQGSTSETALDGRYKAMKEALNGVPGADQLQLDFYDRTRIATWVRCHESLIPWVREQVGRPIAGWHSYGSWAYAPDPADAKYLSDDTLRIFACNRGTGAGESVLEGIRQMRDRLREPRRVVRLVGLSGVGKTRLVQALFDDRIGEQSLNPSIAFYTNMADDANPQPTGLASDLVAAGTPAILVVDNCPPELHQRLSEVCRQERSQLSVITVEYDIREDESEGTEVFTLKTSSVDLIEKLLRLRFTAISQIDAHTIAKISEGNARIAIALAATIERSGTVAGLTGGQLFQRLFLQRHAPDESLYLVAQACSLVYSFEGEDVSMGAEAELTRLGNLIGMTSMEVYRHVAELKRRDLVQQRGVWRAVLPHAMANHLAEVALQNIPYVAIEQQLLTTRSGRIMRSFSRRLGYLHTSDAAKAIVKRWLGEGGLLGNVLVFDELRAAIFENVAPVTPNDVLLALERACAQEPAAVEPYLDLLRSIAYEADHYSRCMTLIATLLVEAKDGEQSRGRRVFTSLLQLYLSGTLAPVEQRLAVIGSLLGSSDPKRRALGVAGLIAVLEPSHFTALGSFDFGARPRDFGYWPLTKEEVQHWFTAVFNLVETLASSDCPVAPEARAALAQQFRAIWHVQDARDALVNCCRKIGKLYFWPEGWLAVRHTLDSDREEMGEAQLKQLLGIEKDLRPADLLQKVRSIVLSTPLKGIDFEEFEDNPEADISTRVTRTEALARELGKAVATDEATFASLLPALVSSDGRLRSFGEGLVEGTTNPGVLWDRLATAFAAVEEEQRKPEVLRGFLSALHAKYPLMATQLLDSCVEHENLAFWYPLLQLAVALNHEGIARLKRSMALGRAPAHMFGCLAYGRVTDPISPPDLKELVLIISVMQAGYNVAVDILSMRLHSEKSGGRSIPQELVEAGCELLGQFSFAPKNDGEDFRIGVVARDCLAGERGAAVVTELCMKLKAAVATSKTHAIYHDDLLTGLFEVQPCAALDGLCGGDTGELERGMRVLREAGGRKYPLAGVPERDLLRWCDKEPASRYPALASVICTIERSNDLPPRWTSVALRFLERAADPAPVLQLFVRRFRPSRGWSGSFATILESNAVLLDQLDGFAVLRDAVAMEKGRLTKWIQEERAQETALDRRCHERFE